MGHSSCDHIKRFSFNDSSCSKESVYWKLGRVTGISGSKVTLKYSLKAEGNEQTVVRSMRDVSIVYAAVGESLSNTLDHFNDERCMHCARYIKTFLE